MLAGVYDDSFRNLSREKKKSSGAKGASAGIERMGDAIDAAMEKAEVKASQLGGIGVGAPGPLDLKRGILLDAPNLGWTDAPVRKLLKDRFDCPVTVINDVDSGIYGEYRFGAARGARTAVGIFPGTGIGGGAVYRGDLVRGEKSSGMEVGHIVVQPGGMLCGCGNRGCLETVASRLAIVSCALVEAYRGNAPHLLEQSAGTFSKIRSGMVAASIEAGDRAVEEIVRRAASWIGVGVASLVHLLVPNVVVLGGGLVEAMPELYVSEVQKSANKNIMSSYRDSFELKVAKLGGAAAMLGAAAWARAVNEAKGGSLVR